MIAKTRQQYGEPNNEKKAAAEQLKRIKAERGEGGRDELGIALIVSIPEARA